MMIAIVGASWLICVALHGYHRHVIRTHNARVGFRWGMVCIVIVVAWALSYLLQGPPFEG